MNTPASLSTLDKKLIKESWKLIHDDPNKIRKLFYTKIFELAPDAKNLFRPSFLNYESLPDSFLFMYENIENLEREIPRIKRLGLKHKTYGVKKKHYPIGQTALIWAIQEHAKKQFTKEMKDAWTKLFDYTSYYMIMGMRRK